MTANKVKKEYSTPSSLAWQHFMSQPLYLLGKNPEPNEQKAGKAPELVCVFEKRKISYPSGELNPGLARRHEPDYDLCTPILKVINVLNS